ncbi:M20 family metallopeptidase [Prauserella endophytica]|uniref:M20/M25/M40 family metallo-hydrolase n=1 Tax=Prauserella endophytica TaxID=1592324 RepID=A0ABY2RWL5_9PSEU|nr:M20/M25/M40 family metallo-hydrolase [Prauserella endophytica]PXY34478.1 deacylase [Prauserella coralliicola]TKG62848.1 M20/M25/M40 family metallo-hydrolase [Prauserella endophytica]
MSERDGWVAEASRHITPERLRELIAGIVDVPSPTGFEAPLAEHLARTLTAAGVPAAAQPIDEHQANALGRLRGDGTGPDLMLYAPIDTLTTGDPEQDVPWIGPELRPDMRPEARHDGDFVTGLGASNPKGHAACVAMAAEAIARAGVPLTGDLVVAFGAGGMPTNALPASARRNTGQGVGCSFLLEQGGWTDFAVIAKPGWTVSWEEVGLAWFDIEVGGTHTYVGSRHRLPYANAIARAGEVAVRLERWFAEFAERHTGGTVSPQGVVSSIEGGWRRMAATTPSACRMRADLRLPPGFSPMAAKRELLAALEEIGKELSVPDIRAELVLAIPGTHTPPDSWVARSAIAAWEEIAGRPHEVIRGNSGATDANILRNRGIPTVRVGMPKVAHAAEDFSLGMNTVDVNEMVRLTRLLVRTAVDTTTRTRSEVGL